MILSINAVVLKERDDLYYAQCLNYDIGAQSRDSASLKDALSRAIYREFILNKSKVLESSKNIPNFFLKNKKNLDKLNFDLEI